MPVRSLNTSVLKWPDEKEVEEPLKRWANVVTLKRKDIRKIGFFGSYARSNPYIRVSFPR